MFNLKVNLCFELHHPLRLNEVNNSEKFDFKNLKSFLFDSALNKENFEKLKQKTYLPTLKIIEELVESFNPKKKNFKVSLNISGIFLDYCENDKELMEILNNLSNSGCVEFLGSTYYHSLASLMNEEEFKNQVKLHSKKLKKLFDQKPKTFVNTELLFDNSVADKVKELGFDSIITDGHERVLDNRNPNSIYISKNGLKVILRNKRLSDDIGFRFSAKGWGEWPLTAEKYSYWVSASPGETVTIYLDIKNFGVHNKEEDGIFWFLKALPSKILDHDNVEFSTPNEVIQELNPVGQIKLPDNEVLSWSGVSPINDMQKKYLKELKDLGSVIKELKNPAFTNIWRLLQMTEHYTDGHGLHNFSNVLQILRNSIPGFPKNKEESSDATIGKSIEMVIEKPNLELIRESSDRAVNDFTEQRPVEDEKKLFFVDEFLDQKISNLEFISNSLKKRTIAS